MSLYPRRRWPRLRAQAYSRPGSLLLAAALAACSADSGSVSGPASGSDATTTPPPTSAPAVNPLAGASFWIDASSSARVTADAWRSARPADAAMLDKIAQQPVAHWFGASTDIRRDVDAATSASVAAGVLPLFVAYNLPQRDCGGSSGGNSITPEAYRSWIADFAAGIAGRRAAVILEPDALAGMDCLSAADQQQRLDLVRYAVQTLTSRPGVALYLDGGNPGWRTSSTMATRLLAAGIAAAQGFALNVSNFHATADNLGYGADISARVGGKHFIIDTGRNGLGSPSDGSWCNPSGRALGERPTTSSAQPLVDAYLWIKAPGESDGPCNGGSATGTFMPDYAVGLAQRAVY